MPKVNRNPNLSSVPREVKKPQNPSEPDMRKDIITVKIIIEARTEEDLEFIIADINKYLKRKIVVYETYYSNGGYASVKKVGNSDTKRKNILFRKF